MDPITIFVVGMASGALIGTTMGSVNYRLGVNDGFMFSKEPTCPGYQRARRILERYGKIKPLTPWQVAREQAMSERPDEKAPR
jgi:hypothetical protein